MIPVAHDDGCGKPAFYLEFLPTADQQLTRSAIFLTDGSHPRAADPCICGACGEALNPLGGPSPVTWGRLAIFPTEQ